jgi:hypothetical protein
MDLSGTSLAAWLAVITGVLALLTAWYGYREKRASYRQAQPAMEYLDINQRLVVPGRDADRTRDPARQGQRRWFELRFAQPLVLALAGVVLLIVGLVVGLVIAPDHKPLYPDGTNPQITECPKDAKVVEEVRITVPANHQWGWLELRHSPNCGTAWGRIVHLSGEPFGRKPQMVVRIVRPDDGHSDEFPYDKPTQAVFTNMLNDQDSCVYAEGRVTVDRDVSPLVRTACHRGGGS